MTKLAPEWVRTSDPVIRSPVRYRWTTAPALRHDMNINNNNSITELLSNNSHLKTIANYVIQAMTERT